MTLPERLEKTKEGGNRENEDNTREREEREEGKKKNEVLVYSFPCKMYIVKVYEWEVIYNVQLTSNRYSFFVRKASITMDTFLHKDSFVFATTKSIIKIVTISIFHTSIFLFFKSMFGLVFCLNPLDNERIRTLWSRESFCCWNSESSQMSFCILLETAKIRIEIWS